MARRHLYIANSFSFRQDIAEADRGQNEDKDYETKIILDKGLVPVDGNIGTTQMTEISSLIPSP
ncbi:MAG: hypothetical protein Q8918_06845 [Bacteroidota bacterium]|nr:hypothetical protein [Bacteroidota bacterium]MDP4211461.1 hypothetical protein [Bacteroidota bacterium]MDP4249810.1 hypothetical protein [Bacteroidota bacterium]